MSTILALTYPSSNNQLKTSPNLMHQVAMPERQTLSCVGNCSTSNDHIARSYTQLKKIQCLKQHMLLAQLQEAGIQLSKDQLVILADTRERIDFWPMCFQHDNMHSSKQMELSYGSDALVEVHNSDNVDNNMINQGVQVIPSSEQSSVMNNSETEITSDSNIIPYSQYVKDSQQAAVQNSNHLSHPRTTDALDIYLSVYLKQLKSQFVEIDRLKQTLSEHVKEKESLMQTVTLLKNDFKKEESRNIDREIALEKKIKQLDNIKVNTTPVDYVALNQLSQDFETRFVPQTELSAEQAFWSQNSKNSSDPTLSIRPTKVEVPKELPKVSMVNTSLKKLKHHLAGFDVVVKERTTATAITEGLWGFEHTKSCFRDEIIPFVKALKDLFNTFDQYLIDELSEVQNVFHQMEQAVEQHRLESKTFEVKMNQVLNENERLLEQVINKDIVNIIMNSSVDNAYVNVHECEKCLKLETELLNKKDFIEKETYDKLFRSFTTLEKHCISLEVDTQLNQEIFQRDNSFSNQSAPSFNQYFELNELKAQSQEKDTVIKKLKERIKSLIVNINEDKIKKEIEEIETINIELEHREQGLVIIALKDELRKLKGKGLADNVVTKHTIAPEMLNIDVETLNPRLLNNRSAYSDYLKHTQEEAAILKEIVEQRKLQNPLNTSLDSACDKLVAVTLKNKDKRVRFTEPVTSSGNTNTKTTSSSNLVYNKPILPSIGVKPSTSASGSQPSGNTKKDKIQRTPRNENVQHSKFNANSKLLCVKCNGCMLSDNHDLCVLDFINDVNARNKSKSVKKSQKRKVWKPTGKVFTNIGYTWRPTGRTFTIVGNVCPLTRITTTAEVTLRKPTALESDTPKLVVTLVNSRKPKKSKTNVPVSKPKIIKSISANKKEPSKS
ncbi:hypothetical protein Tco_0900950 [Tanacetum coccineum]